MKYGCNPHQNPSSIYTIKGTEEPFKVLNGTPGYINLLDALNAYQLVKECRESLNLPAAASFKHVSPAGVGLAVPLTDLEKQAYEVDADLSGLALAYVRARNADPMCSYGDFAAMSDVVDVETAKKLKFEVSDGIIAPGYEPEALEILKTKKSGQYVILQANPDYKPPEMEYREVYGVVFAQKRNDCKITEATLQQVKTKNTQLPADAQRDLVLAQIAVKYTQSNSVGFAKNGQMLGIGAGQQSRVDCTKLAGRKVATWYLRQHPKVNALPFKKDVKKVARINARVRYIEGDFTEAEKKEWLNNFESVPEPLTQKEKEEWISSLKGVSCSSDAFFPFRDGIDTCARFGVSYVVHPGGSQADKEVIDAADEYGMVMSFSGLRLFHH
uniref:Phosphoribosylaminoimidazolecarboxamide formyltransferase n=1 Tax=Arcella intermedia TaxID=1963864 RepID=A0A6B2L659_9EUKA